MVNLGGDLELDETYRSGISGCDGACFVIRLNTEPLIDVSSVEMRESMRTSLRNSMAHSINKSTNNVQILQPSNTPDRIPSNTDILSSSAQPPASTVLPTELRVLFVDDDRLLRRLFTRALHRVQSSWEIREAACGEIALEVCETEQFDLIFMDRKYHENVRWTC